jgi:hypothetical protein
MNVGNASIFATLKNVSHGKHRKIQEPSIWHRARFKALPCFPCFRESLFVEKTLT